MNLSHNPSLRLAGRNALVTGGSRGIGAAIAEAFSREGASLALVHHRDGERAQGVCDKIGAFDRLCLQFDCNVADEAVVAETVRQAAEEMGGIDILVNCAGVGGGGALESFPTEVWDNAIAVNLTGSFFMSRACYPAMKARGWGRIINIASQMAFSGGIGVAAYCASKAGVIGLTRALAVEAAPHGVLVNCIAPGATMTDMLVACGEPMMTDILNRIPLGRFAEPEEIAPVAVMLASEDGSFFVGQTLSPNGGDVLR
jgi:3-oxoacyl-[acyl-carrier protein] reductase